MSDEIRKVTHIDNVRLSDDGTAVVIIDQTLLPGELKYIELKSAESLYEAIKQLRHFGTNVGENWPVVYLINNSSEMYIGETVDVAKDVEWIPTCAWQAT